MVTLESPRIGGRFSAYVGLISVDFRREVTPVFPLRSDPPGFIPDPALERCAIDDSGHIAVGSHGDHVKKIQTALNKLSAGHGRENFALKRDGWYGPKTAAAVKAYKVGFARSGPRYNCKPERGHHLATNCDCRCVNPSDHVGAHRDRCLLRAPAIPNTRTAVSSPLRSTRRWEALIAHFIAAKVSTRGRLITRMMPMPG